MKAMILAAGKGTRVRPLTYELPKPMIPIMGKPVMEYIIEELAQHGFNDIMINVSHLPEKIENYFGNGQRLGVSIGYSFEGYIKGGKTHSTALGSGGGLKRIQDFSGFFDDTFLVVCGDALIDLDLTAALRKHWQSSAVVSVCALEVPTEQVPNYGVVVCDEESRIISFQEKPTVEEAKSNLVNTGIYIFEPEVLDLIPSDTEYDIGNELFPKLVELKLPFYVIDIPFTWIDIGQIRDYWDANQQLMNGALRDVPMPGKEVKPGVWQGINVRVDWNNVDVQGPAYIGSSTSIEPGATIVGPTWIGNGCHVCAGAYVTRSIIFEYTRIGKNSVIKDSVAFGQYCVDRHGNTTETDDLNIGWVSDTRVKG